MTDEISEKDKQAEELEKLVARQTADSAKKYDPKLITAFVQELRALEQLSREHAEKGNTIKGAYHTFRKKYRDLGLDVPNVILGLKAADNIHEITAEQAAVYPLLRACTEARGYAAEEDLGTWDDERRELGDGRGEHSRAPVDHGRRHGGPGSVGR